MRRNVISFFGIADHSLLSSEMAVGFSPYGGETCITSSICLLGLTFFLSSSLSILPLPIQHHYWLTRRSSKEIGSSSTRPLSILVRRMGERSSRIVMVFCGLGRTGAGQTHMR